MNKPNKKTEWVEILSDKMDSLRCMSCSKYFPESCEDCSFSEVFDDVVDYFSSLLHQRENEIREWANYSRCHDNTKGTPEFGYNACLDDLLTYLSNKEEPIK